MAVCAVAAMGLTVAVGQHAAQPVPATDFPVSGELLPVSRGARTAGWPGSGQRVLVAQLAFLPRSVCARSLPPAYRRGLGGFR